MVKVRRVFFYLFEILTYNYSHKSNYNEYYLKVKFYIIQVLKNEIGGAA